MRAKPPKVSHFLKQVMTEFRAVFPWQHQKNKKQQTVNIQTMKESMDLWFTKNTAKQKLCSELVLQFSLNLFNKTQPETSVTRCNHKFPGRFLLHTNVALHLYFCEH